MYFVGQFIFAILGILVHALAEGGRRRVQGPDRLQGAVLGAGIGSAAAVFWATRRWARELARDPSPSGLGLVRPRAKAISLSALAGATLAAAYLASLIFLSRYSSHSEAGPLAKMAAQSGSGRLIWALFAIVIAPPTEEVLFRGLLLKGLTASWGLRAASVVTTLIFVVLHLQETRSNLLGCAAICSLSLAALAARLWTGSLYCSIALHFAYNLFIVMAVYAIRGL